MKYAAQTPQDRLLRLGPGVLNDAELLALFLRSNKTGVSTVDLARQVLAHFGSLTNLMSADLDAISGVEGLSPARFALLQGALEISRRHVFTTLCERSVLDSPADVRQYLSLHLAGLPHEVFVGLFLDNRHRVIEYRELFRGTIDSAAVYPREILKRCLACNAAAVIFAHNHPSGIAEPSDTDVRLTRRLTEALRLIDVRVLDHLIIGQGVQTSLAERGLL